MIKEMISHCVQGKIDDAYLILKSLWDKGYSPHDIITNIFRVCKNHQMAEYLKLEFIKVCVFCSDDCINCLCVYVCVCVCVVKDIGMTHLRLTEGMDSLLQLSGLLARLCSKAAVETS